MHTNRSEQLLYVPRDKELWGEERTNKYGYSSGASRESVYVPDNTQGDKQGENEMGSWLMSAPTLAVGFTGSHYHHSETTTFSPPPSATGLSKPPHLKIPTSPSSSPLPTTINAHARSAHQQRRLSVAGARGCCCRCSFVSFAAN
jgi:hypothetical protein